MHYIDNQLVVFSNGPYLAVDCANCGDVATLYTEAGVNVPIDRFTRPSLSYGALPETPKPPEVPAGLLRLLTDLGLLRVLSLEELASASGFRDLDVRLHCPQCTKQFGPCDRPPSVLAPLAVRRS